MHGGLSPSEHIWYDARMKTMKAWAWSSAIFVFSIIPTLAGAVNFDRDLSLGMRNDPDVVRLQDFLRAQGYFTYPQSTGNFLSATFRAVKAFQTAQDVGIGGYFGPQTRAAANRIINSAASPVTSPQGTSAPGVPANTSPYRGKIVISYLWGGASKASGEYMILENKSEKDTISVTGFSVENSLGNSFTIPKASALPGFSAAPNSDFVTLRPRDRVTIFMGKQERGLNFRENLCTGYFDESSDFPLSLDHSCPRPDIPLKYHFTDRCFNLIESAGACRIGRVDQFVEPACANFITDHLNYTGCVRDNRDRPDFYLRRWLVWMQRDEEFFHNRRESVVLKDTQGKIVDEYNY